MSKIIVVVQAVPNEQKVEVISRIRAITGKAISEISRNLHSGEPVVIEELFMNDHDEVAVRLRRLVRELPVIGVRLSLFEVLPAYDPSEEPTPNDKISVEVLENILDAAEDRKNERHEKGDGHDATAQPATRRKFRR